MPRRLVRRVATAALAGGLCGLLGAPTAVQAALLSRSSRPLAGAASGSTRPESQASTHAAPRANVTSTAASVTCGTSSGLLFVLVSGAVSADSLDIEAVGGNYAISLDTTSMCTSLSYSDATYPAVFVTTVDSSVFPITFTQPSTPDNMTFGTNAPDATLDLSEEPAATVVAPGADTEAAPGTVSFGDSTDAFYGVSAVSGSSEGSTQFVPGSAFDLTFTGLGADNELNASDVATSSPLVVNVGEGTLSVSSELDNFSGIQTFIGSSTGSTSFITGATGGFTFTGYGTSNSLSFGDVSPLELAAGGVQVFLVPNSQGEESAEPGSGTDFFSGISTVIGSPNNDTFNGGPGTWILEGGGGSDTLDDSSAISPATVSLSNGTGTITGAFSGSTTTTDVTTFIGSSNGSNTFDADGYGGYAFESPDGSSDNTLSFAAVEADAGVNGVALDVTSSSGSGSASGLSAAVTGSSVDSFSDVQTFLGSPYADAFSVGSGTFALEGDDESSLSLGGASGPVTISSSSVTGSSIDDAISGFDSFVGSASGSTTFIAPPGGGYDFTGRGSNNVLDLSAAPSGTTVDVGDDTTASPGGVSGLSSGLAGSTADTFAGIQSFAGVVPPAAPTQVSGTAGKDGNSVVSFAPPTFSGDSAITGYEVTATDLTNPANGGQVQSGASSPITVTGLTNGDDYTFSVAAVNSDGSGPLSVPSTPVTPAGPPIATISIPPGGGTYGYDTAVKTSFSCADGAGGSGIASCVDSNGATGPSGHLITTTIGQGSYSVTATSKDGQSTTTTIHFKVVQATQTIRFTSTPAHEVYGGKDYTVTATGGASGNPVVFSIAPASASVCKITASAVRFVGVGVCTIDANQTGNSDYAKAGQAQQSFAVGKAAVTVEAAATPSTTTSSKSITLVATLSNHGATGTVAFVEGSVSLCTATVTNGKASCKITVSLGKGTYTVTAKYGGSKDFLAATSPPVKITIT